MMYQAGCGGVFPNQVILKWAQKPALNKYLIDLPEPGPTGDGKVNILIQKPMPKIILMN